MEFKKSELAIIKVIDRQVTKEGFSLNASFSVREDEITLCKKINLENFPSFKDFEGHKTVVKHDQLCIVINKIGRPFKIVKKEKWSKYDIYEILVNGQKFQIFKFNLDKIKQGSCR